MFDAGVLTFREFMMREAVPLASIQGAVLEFLRGRDDAMLVGDQAVNAYVDDAQMTPGMDLMSTRAEALAEDMKEHLGSTFHIAVRVRPVADGLGFRLFQVRKEGNRHLVDLRQVDALPPSQRIAGVLVMAPAELVASKVVSYHNRRGQPKAGTDWRDIAMLLLEFPKLREERGVVFERLRGTDAPAEMLKVWGELRIENIHQADEDSGF